MPLTIRHTLHTSCAELTRLGGPDLLEASLRILHEEVSIPCDEAVVGTYGGHSDVSRAAALAYEATGTVVDDSGREAPPLWICGHFVAKAFAQLLDDAACENLRGQTLLLWQTKSAVQPRGEKDEWDALLQMPTAVRQWANNGHAESSLRPGKVDTIAGQPEDYRHIMTPLQAQR
mmetsp:Transcript_57133/g.113480  ORF Transcript_57133/g.113480 Transcript_57133/m.113480 type:complete len:175 (-) Transcript_57133:140-664(-)